MRVSCTAPELNPLRVASSDLLTRLLESCATDDEERRALTWVMADPVLGRSICDWMVRARREGA